MIGLQQKILPAKYVFCIPQNAKEKGDFREIKNIYESNAINANRFNTYRAKHGFIGNYGLPIGQDIPVPYNKDEGSCSIKSLHYYWIKNAKDTQLPDFIQTIKYDNVNIYYFVWDSNNHTTTEWLCWSKWREIGTIVASGRQVVDACSSIDKLIKSVYEEWKDATENATKI